MFLFHLTRPSPIRMALAFLVLATLACNAPWYADTAVEPTALPPLIGTTPNSQGTPISQVGAGTATPGLAPTTTAAPQLIALQDMNLRQGPSTQYPVVGALPKDQNALIVGQNPEGTWWKIACPPGATGAECWISGGAQFTTASNAAAVPLAVVPPTPTAPPAPPTAAPSPLTAPTLFYLAGGDVWQVGLQLGGSNDVSRTADPQKLTSLGSVIHFWVAPDGRRLLLQTEAGNSQTLALFDLSARQLQNLVSTSTLPALPTEYGNVDRIFGTAAWFPNSQKIAFTSNFISREGPGLGSLDDWWVVDMAGTASQILPPGQAGGAFAIAPTGTKVLFATAREILLANVDGSDKRSLISFESVVTYSEYQYYPQPVWTADGQSARVAIPSPDPLDASAFAQLWRVGADGTAVPQGRVLGNTLFNPVFWSADGARLAYVRQIIAASNPPVQLVLAQGNGDAPTDYGNSVAGSIRFLNWNPAGDRLAYVGLDSSGRQTPYVGQASGAFTSLPFDPTAQLTQLLWLDATRYVAMVAQADSTALYWGNETGQTAALATIPTRIDQAAVWR